MKKIILLAVDGQHPVPAAAEFTRELSRDTGDQVVVLHVHEFAVGRFGRLQVDCPDSDGDRLVNETVAALKDAGVDAGAEVRETGIGQVSRAILEAADRHDARLVVLGSSGRTDLPHVPFGSVAHRLLHQASRPVLIVPRH